MKSKFDYSLIKRVGDLANDGVAVYDLEDNQFLYTNQNFLKIFELGKDAVKAGPRAILKQVYSEDQDYLRARTDELMSSGAIGTTEFRLELPGDVTRYLSCDIMMVDNKKVITAFVKDVSKTKKHEDFLIKYTAQKDIMLDMLTHNLGGPLQLSKDVVSRMQESGKENITTSINELVCVMHENTQQCIDIVNDFLREEHLESSFTHLRNTRFEVIGKIKLMLVKLREINKDKTFNFTADVTSLTVSSDAVKFFQVIHNVLSNAVKFTRQQDGVIDINVLDNNDFYSIEIKDNGIGIPAGLHPQIFTERLKGRTGLKGEKSKGLGLYIANRLVRLMGGEILLNSRENEGTTVLISFPKKFSTGTASH
jgi:two-component system, OmpR family, sensor histidine kinase VicK